MTYLILGGLSLFMVGILHNRLRMVTPEDIAEVTDECKTTKCDYLKYIEHGNFNFY